MLSDVARVCWLVDCILRVGSIRNLRFDLVPYDSTADICRYLWSLVQPFEKLHGMQSAKFHELPGELRFLSLSQGMC